MIGQRVTPSVNISRYSNLNLAEKKRCQLCVTSYCQFNHDQNHKRHVTVINIKDQHPSTGSQSRSRPIDPVSTHRPVTWHDWASGQIGHWTCRCGVDGTGARPCGATNIRSVGPLVLWHVGTGSSRCQQSIWDVSRFLRRGDWEL